MACNNLVLVLGDQLWLGSPALAFADSVDNPVVMIEASQEASYVPQHKMRLVLFFAAMRHFRDALRKRGHTVCYSALDDEDSLDEIGAELSRRIAHFKPQQVVCLEPGDYRVKQMIESACARAETGFRLVTDSHFLSSVEAFRDHMVGRKALVMEYFYRDLRRRTGILMDGNAPVGGQWNYDGDNRKPFARSGPPEIRAPRRFHPDPLTREVIALVEKRFAGSPGTLEQFDYPVTHEQARDALDDFIENRLHNFGSYQDAMATGHPYLFHSRISSSLNLHLLDPREAINAALARYETGEAELNSVEGFVRQILGWREFVRGVYWAHMPDYAGQNALGADLDMPAFMWTGETDMACVRDSVAQLIDHAYAHHIQRLMVLGLFSLLLGARPFDVHRWHMSMYIDAIDWVSLPNVLGMSQYGDGGLVGTKPYAASGNYINKMSDYCAGCRFKPGTATGDDACPITTLYWNFLSRNRSKLETNRRMGFQFKNLDRKDDTERRAINDRADRLKAVFTRQTYL